MAQVFSGMRRGLRRPERLAEVTPLPNSTRILRATPSSRRRAKANRSTRIEDWALHQKKLVPFLIESQFAREQGLDPCARICRHLLQAGCTPVPHGETVAEVNQIARSMKSVGCEAAIFVVNTLDAKGMIQRLDPVMGEAPALFLRRELMAGKSGLTDHLVPDPDTAHTLHVLGKLTIRLTSIWYYGSRNLDQVAGHAANAILRFLEDRQFRHIEAMRNYTANGFSDTRFR